MYSENCRPLPGLVADLLHERAAVLLAAESVVTFVQSDIEPPFRAFITRIDQDQDRDRDLNTKPKTNRRNSDKQHQEASETGHGQRQSAIGVSESCHVHITWLCTCGRGQVTTSTQRSGGDEQRTSTVLL